MKGWGSRPIGAGHPVARSALMHFWTNPPQMRVASRPRTSEAGRMDTPDLDADELFLDAVNAVVVETLARIGDDPDARFAFFRLLLTVAEEEGRRRS